MQTKLCNRCGRTQPVENFHRRRQRNGEMTGFQHRCKECCAATKTYKKHEVARRRHGFTDEQYSEIMSRVPDGCEICGRDMGKKVCFDHCHDSGEFRGLLCHSCNTMLGLAKDNIATLERAIRYLKSATPNK